MMKLNPKHKQWVKRLLVAFWLCLLVPGLQIAMVRFANPPTTMPLSTRWLKGLFHPSLYQPSCYHWIKIRELPETYLGAVYITEDRHFFEHWGFDWEEIQKAREEARASGKPARGASTITQQCARSLFLWQGRSWFRKGLEAYYTVWMELLLSKKRILELYVNVIELGEGIYGVEAAAQKFYGVSAAKLTREQSAMLVAIMPNPKQLNPNHPSEKVLRREAVILERMEYVVLPIKLE